MTIIVISLSVPDDHPWAEDPPAVLDVTDSLDSGQRHAAFEVTEVVPGFYVEKERLP